MGSATVRARRSPTSRSGNNSVAGVQQLPPDAGTPFAVTGYNTTPGYDLASGLGTVDGAQLVGALTRYRSFSTRH